MLPVNSRVILAAAAGALFPLLATSPLYAQAPLSVEQLRAGFAAPPSAARLRCYWWWLNGNTDKPTITHDLEQMRAKGYGGALLVDANGSDQTGNNNVPAGPTFASPAWMELYTHAMREADRLGLDITLNITSGWNLGGPDVTPEQASKLLTWTRVQVSGGKRIDMPLPMPETRNSFYRQIVVLAYPLHHGVALQPQPPGPSLRERSAAAETGFSMPDSTEMLDAGADATNPATADAAPDEVRNVTAQVDAQGNLTWDAPAGEWEILRIGYTDSGALVSTSSGAWQGLGIDYLSKAAFNTYWDHTVEPLLRAAKPFHSLKYLATDSWELGGTNWTDTFAAEFQQRRGYDPLPWLPVVAGRFVGSRDQSERFLADLRRTVGDLVSANHYDLFAQHAAEHGLGIQAESGGPHGAPIDALETFRHSAVPQSEFWSQNAHRSRDNERFFTKEAASAANIYGKTLVAQEGETSIGPQWSESLATDLKPSFDMAITEGMNRLVWHEFTSSPAATGLPGQEYFAGTHLNPKVTWWNAGNAFFRYLNRAQFVMQQGVPVDDVLYFAGDNVPGFVRLKADDPAHVLPGYDYDVTNEDALLHSIHMDGHELVGPTGVRWRVLVMPTDGRVSLAGLERIASFVQQGATVIGKPPLSPTGRSTPQELARFGSIVMQLWGSVCEPSPRPYGSGQVVCSSDTRAALATLHIVPDVILQEDPGAQGEASTSRFDYVHRRLGGAEIYFVRNGSAQESSVHAIFRADGKTPQLWDAVTGDTRETPRYKVLADGRVQVQLVLPAYGSSFVVFAGHGPQDKTATASSVSTVPLATLHPWTVSFEPNRGAPAAPVVFPELKSWTDSSDLGIRYFSGTATYRVEVAAPPAAKDAVVQLAFTGLREIARVRVNGHDAGTVWAQPLTLRVDPWLHPGTNRLEIEVTNLWPNRIIGDLQPGDHPRFTSTNITAYHADSPLLPSGIIGPLTWKIGR